MPQTTIKRKPALSTRKSSDRRKNEQSLRRKAGNRAEQKAPAIIADSFSSLKVVAKPGIAVSLAISDKRFRGDEADDYEQMYHDLLACLHKALAAIGTPSTFDPLASGLNLTTSLAYVVNAFKNNVLPKDFEFNIDRETFLNDHKDVGYYFTIYRCVPYNEYWHEFTLMPVVRSIQHDKKLLRIFFQVFKCFIDKADINAWWNGALGYVEYMFLEHLEDWEGHADYDDEEESEKKFEEWYLVWLEYQAGEQKQIEETFKSLPYIKPEQLFKDLKKFSPKDPVVKWLKEACEFLILPGCIGDYIYYEDENLEGLKYDDQSAILWDLRDRYTNMQLECLDSEAQTSGINGPVLHFSFTKHLKSFSLEELAQRAMWPAKLTEINQSYNKLVNKINPDAYAERED